jgi:anti-anti-sigma regulatory factor
LHLVAVFAHSFALQFYKHFVLLHFTSFIPNRSALKFLQKTYVIINFQSLSMKLRNFLNKDFLSLEGRLYSGNLSEVQYKIEMALDKTPSLIIDLDPLEKFDAAGAYMLYIASEKARENNKEIILFCRKNEMVKKTFAFVGIKYSNKLSLETKDYEL